MPGSAYLEKKDIWIITQLGSLLFKIWVGRGVRRGWRPFLAPQVCKRNLPWGASSCFRGNIQQLLEAESRELLSETGPNEPCILVAERTTRAPWRHDLKRHGSLTCQGMLDGTKKVPPRKDYFRAQRSLPHLEGLVWIQCVRWRWRVRNCSVWLSTFQNSQDSKQGLDFGLSWGQPCFRSCLPPIQRPFNCWKESWTSWT